MKENNLGDLLLVTKITLENGKVYFLYSDGNLYEKDANGEMKILDNLNEENKQTIDKIMERFKAPPIDVIDNERNDNERD